MPEHLKALVVILALATVLFVVAKAPACELAFTQSDFERRRNLWLGMLLAGFLAHNFWLYIVAAAVMLYFTISREKNHLATFFFLLFAMPALSGRIPGLGVVEYFFSIDYVRLLILMLLFPAYLYLRKQPGVDSFGKLLPDKLFIAYLVLNFLLTFNFSTFTNILRHTVFYAFVDFFLPYYVASRSLKTIERFREALMGFALAALVLAAIGAFEYVKHWLVYSTLQNVLNSEPWGYSNYLGRGESLRALGSTGQPIVFGYVMTISIGFYLYLQKSISDKKAWYIGLALLVIGLIAPVSRGPWVGAAVMLIVFVATGPSAGKNFVKIGLLVALVLPVILLSPGGDKIIDLIPFVGKTEEFNVTYRQQFTEISIRYILDNPFGGTDFINSPEMAVLKNQGIIDTLNVFLVVGLGGGVLGMFLFSGVFLVTSLGIFNRMRTEPDKNGELFLLGRALLSAFIGMIITLCTTSSITIIPVIYWSVAGLGVAYIRLITIAPDSRKVSGSADRPGLQSAGMKTYQ